MLDCRYYDLCSFMDDSCNGYPECPKRERCQFYSPMPDVRALMTLADECDSVHMHKVAARVRDALGVNNG